MSLLDGFLRDALLQNVAMSDVYVAIRNDNPNSPGYAIPVGSGTASDPFGGPANSGDWFDYVMSHLPTGTPAGSIPVTVRIGPGEFLTKGGSDTAQAWAATSGMRILGAGIGETVLRLAA